MNAVAERAARFVCERTGISPTDLLSQRRQAPLVRARKLFVWAVRWWAPEISYAAIGRMLSGRDHTSIIHLYREAVFLIGYDSAFRELTEDWKATARRTMEVPRACA